MPRETRTSKTKITFELSPSLRDKLKKYCKKNRVSVAQYLRDTIQAELKRAAIKVFINNRVKKNHKND